MNYPDRVRAATSDKINARIDRQTLERLKTFEHKTPAEITQRIHELDNEWDMERVLEANASTLALTGLVGGLTIHRKWFALPAVVLPFLLWHALRGWCPPVPVLRRMGVRTRHEIDQEKYALKAMRGDFDELEPASAAGTALRSTRH